MEENEEGKERERVSERVRNEYAVVVSDEEVASATLHGITLITSSPSGEREREDPPPQRRTERERHTHTRAHRDR